MRIIIVVLGLITFGVALVLIVGAFLPEKHRVAREIVLYRPAAKIYAVVRDFPSGPAWRLSIRRVEMLETVDGRVRFREEDDRSAVTYEMMEDKSHERLVTRIVNRDLGYHGTWTYQFISEDAAVTRVRITEDGETPNLAFRFFSRFIFGHTRTIDTYLQALGHRFNQNVVPK